MLMRNFFVFAFCKDLYGGETKDDKTTEQIYTSSSTGLLTAATSPQQYQVRDHAPESNRHFPKLQFVLMLWLNSGGSKLIRDGVLDNLVSPSFFDCSAASRFFHLKSRKLMSDKNSTLKLDGMQYDYYTVPCAS
jgi:hypothetical protein